jgi:hypothetical protein
MAQAAQSIKEVTGLSLKSYALSGSASTQGFLLNALSAIDESDYDSSLRYPAKALKSSISKVNADDLAYLPKGGSETLNAFYGFEAASLAAEAVRESMQSRSNVYGFVALADASALFNARAEIILCRMLRQDDSDAREGYARIKATLDSFAPKWKDYIKAHQRIEPTPEDTSKLIKTMNGLYSMFGEYDFKSNSVIYVLEAIADLYKHQQPSDEVVYFFRNIEAEYIEDSFSKLVDDYIRSKISLSFEEADWVLENIFHVAPDHSIDANSVYAYNNRYQVDVFQRPYWYAHENEILEYRPLGDGRYAIAFSTTVTNSFDEEDTYNRKRYLIADLQLIDNERRWTFYEISAD